jgi:hypothetical protein
VADLVGDHEANVEVSAVVFNWRGAIAPRSYTFLRDELGFSRAEVEVLSLKVLEGGFGVYVGTCRSTRRSACKGGAQSRGP